MNQKSRTLRFKLGIKIREVILKITFKLILALNFILTLRKEV